MESVTPPSTCQNLGSVDNHDMVSINKAEYNSKLFGIPDQPRFLPMKNAESPRFELSNMEAHNLQTTFQLRCTDQHCYETSYTALTLFGDAVQKNTPLNIYLIELLD